MLEYLNNLHKSGEGFTLESEADDGENTLR
jgi:hypothetical protein